MTEGSDLLMFYGTECEHCHEMEPFLEKLEKEEGIVVSEPLNPSRVLFKSPISSNIARVS